MRHVHCGPGATAEVLATWTELLGDRAWVITRDEAIGAGLFGPIVTPRRGVGSATSSRSSRGELGIVQRRRESRLSSMPGHHGALTDARAARPLAGGGAVTTAG